MLPAVTSTQARIKIQGAGIFFYDVSDVNFSVIPGSDGPFISLAGTALVSESCFPTNGAVDPMNPSRSTGR